MAGKLRPVRFDQLNRQFDELGLGDLQEITMTDGRSVFIRLGNSIDSSDAQEFQDRLRAAQEEEDTKPMALVILGYHPELTAEDQWAIWEENGGTADRLALMFGALTADQQERLGKIRPKR